MPSTTLTLKKPIAPTPKPQARQSLELPRELDRMGDFEDYSRSEPAIQEVAPPRENPEFRGEIRFVSYTPNVEEINRDSTAVFPPLATIEKTVNIVAKAAETIGKLAPDVTDSMKDLIWGQIVGREKKAPKKDDPKEVEKQVKQAEANFQYNRGQETNQEIKKVSTENVMKAVMNTEPEIASLSDEDKNKKMGLQKGYKSNTPLDKYHLAELRRILIAEKLAAQTSKKQQSMAEVRGKGGPDLDLNKVGEGGSILSSTGGAGAG